jgi:hypothetical protein
MSDVFNLEEFKRGVPYITKSHRRAKFIAILKGKQDEAVLLVEVETLPFTGHVQIPYMQVRHYAWGKVNHPPIEGHLENYYLDGSFNGGIPSDMDLIPDTVFHVY